MHSVFCTSTITPTEGSTEESASTARIASKKLPPAPPNRSGISIPIRPISNSCRISPASIFCASSIPRTRGAIFAAANFRTVSRKKTSSSPSCVSATGLSCVIVSIALLTP